MSSSKKGNFGNLIVFDLSRLGTAYQIINEFADDSAVRVFEVSPVADRAVVMLQSNDLIASHFVLSQARSLFHNDVLQSTLVENVEEEIISAYLSQSQAPVLSHFLIAECCFFSSAFNYASTMAKSRISLLDFRALRTNPANLVLTFTDESFDYLFEHSSKNAGVRTTLVKDVKAPLKSYFEIIK